MKGILKIFIIALILFPFGFLLALSLSRQWIYPAILPKEIGFMNWQQLFGYQKNLWESLGLSLLISSFVAFSATSLGFFMGRFIAYHPQKSTLLKLAYFPYVISPVVYATCLNIYFNYYDLSGTWLGVILAQCIITFPFCMILFSGYWNENLKAVEQLVATLGGNSRQTLFKVLIPMSRNILLLSFFQAFLISWFEYGLTNLIGIGKVNTLTIMVFRYIGEANIYIAALASCLLVIPPLFLLWFNKKFVWKQLL